MSVNRTPMGINAADLAAYSAKRTEEEIKTELLGFMKELGAAICSSTREVMMIHKELAAIHQLRGRADVQIKIGGNYVTISQIGFGPGCDEDFVRNGCNSISDILSGLQEAIDKRKEGNNENDC